MHIDLTDRQRSRLEQLIKEAEAVEAKIKPLQDLLKAFQMSISAVMSTILEAHGAPDEQQFALSADLKRLVPVEREE